MAAIRKSILIIPARASISYHTSAATNTKHSKADIIKLHREYQCLYGRLLEKKKEKIMRLKLEEKGLIPEQKANNVDSEQAWMLSKTRNDRIRTFARKLNKTNCEEDNHQTAKGNLMTSDTDNTRKDANDSNCDSEKQGDDIIVNVNATNNTKSIESTTTPRTKYNRPVPQLSVEEIENMKIVKLFDIPEKTIEDLPTEIMQKTWTDNEFAVKYPSVSWILDATMSEQARKALEYWTKNLIAKLGEDGFKAYKQEILSSGQKLHQTVVQQLQGKSFSVPQECQLAYKSLENVLDEISNIRALESTVAHPLLYYKGVVDCVATYRGKICTIEWKRAESKKYSIERTYDAPLQVASYAGAINSSEIYPFKVEAGLIVVAYTDGEKASVYELDHNDLKKYWHLWLTRLHQFYLLHQNTAA